MIVYKLNQSINSSKLIKDIQSLINKEIKKSSKEYLLVIKIQEVSYDDTSCIPKLLDNTKTGTAG